MVTAVEYPKNLDVTIRGQIADGAGNTDVFIPLNPTKKTIILVDKNGESATVSVAANTRDLTNSPITDLEHADVIFLDVSTGTTDYLAGDNAGLTGLKINANPSGADVDYTVLQY